MHAYLVFQKINFLSKKVNDLNIVDALCVIFLIFIKYT